MHRDAEGDGARRPARSVGRSWLRGCSCSRACRPTTGGASDAMRDAIALGRRASSGSARSSRTRAAIRASSTTMRRLPSAPRRDVVTAARAGFVAGLDAELIGRAAVALGAGRDRVEDAVDPAVGIDVLRRRAPRARGRRRSRLHHRAGRGLDEALALARRRRDRRRAGAARPASSWKMIEETDVRSRLHRPFSDRRSAVRQREATSSRRRPRLAVAAGARRAATACRALQPLVGLIVILAIAYAFSTDRRAIDGRTVAWGLGLQLLFALHRAEDRDRPARVRDARRRRSTGCSASRSSGSASSSVRSATARSGPRHHDRRARARRRAATASSSRSRCCRRSSSSPRCSPSSITSASCRSSSALFAVVMHRVMRASGAESLNVAASIFMGQTEAPLTIRPYLPKMTESELMTVMTVRHGAHLRRHHGRLHPVRHRSRSTC